MARWVPASEWYRDYEERRYEGSVLLEVPTNLWGVDPQLWVPEALDKQREGRPTQDLGEVL